MQATKMLIAVSSKHGSTREIAESIAETVREAGIEVEVVDAQSVGSVAPYDARHRRERGLPGPLDGTG